MTLKILLGMVGPWQLIIILIVLVIPAVIIVNILAKQKDKKQCPYCGEKILPAAKKCKHCGEWLENR